MLRNRAGAIGLQWTKTVAQPQYRSRLGITTEELHAFVRDWPRSGEGRRLLEGLRCGLLWVTVAASCWLDCRCVSATPGRGRHGWCQPLPSLCLQGRQRGGLAAPSRARRGGAVAAGRGGAAAAGEGVPAHRQGGRGGRQAAGAAARPGAGDWQRCSGSLAAEDALRQGQVAAGRWGAFGGRLLLNHICCSRQWLFLLCGVLITWQRGCGSH